MIGMASTPEEIEGMREEFGDRFEETTTPGVCHSCSASGFALAGTAVSFMKTYPDEPLVFSCIQCLQKATRSRDYYALVEDDGLDLAWGEYQKSSNPEEFIAGIAAGFIGEVILDPKVRGDHPILKPVAEKMIEMIESNPATSVEVQKFKDMVLTRMKKYCEQEIYVGAILYYQLSINNVRRELERRGLDIS